MTAQRKGYWAHALMGALLLAVGLPAWAPADEVRDEIAFASGLVRLGFSDYAEKVLTRVMDRYPDREDDARAVRAEILMATRDFEAVEEIAKTFVPDSTEGKTIRLELANAYYLAGQTEQAKALYDDFFSVYEDRPPDDPDLLRFYRDAAWRFGLMLEQAQDYEGAARNMDRALASDPEPEQRRQIQEKKAEQLIRQAETAKAASKSNLLAAVEDLCTEIEYGGPFWVGKATVLRARAKLAVGDGAAALTILDDQKSAIRALDRSFRTSGVSLEQSPRAGWHFVRGRVHEVRGMAEAAEAKDQEARNTAKKTLAVALNEYARVLKDYGESPYATDAMLSSTAVEDQLIALGARIVRKEKPPSLGAGKAGQIYRSADILFQNERYAEAIKAYLDILNRVPESAATPRALVHLGKAYGRLGDVLMARVVTGYLAERFTGDPEAAKGCLLLAGFFREIDQVPAALETYRLIGAHFPDHEKAPAALYTAAMADRKEGRRPAALAALHDIVKRYPKSAFYLDALTVLGTEYRKSGDAEKALTAWSVLAVAAPEGRKKAVARMFEAEALSRLGRTAEALAVYAGLAKDLDPGDPNNPYYVNDEDRDAVITLWEQADLQVGYTLVLYAETSEDADASQAKAIQVYEAFASRHPDSSRIPKALAAQGGVLLRMDRVDEAAGVFEHLSRDYPDTPEGKNSLFTLASSAVQAGKIDVARDAVQRMVDDATAFGPDMLAAIGQLMLTNNLYDEAQAVFEQVRRNTDDATLQEYALFGLGKSYFERGDFPRSIEALDTLLELNSRTALFYEAKFLLGRANRTMGDYDAALAALTDVFKFTQDPRMKRKADLELALIQEEQGRLDAAYASYLRIALYPDPAADLAVAPLIEQGMLRAVDLGMERGTYDDVLFICDRYLTFFGDGKKVDYIRRKRREAGLEQARQPAPSVGAGS